MGAGVTEAWIPGGQQPARHADHHCPFMCLLQGEGTIHLPRPGAPERARGTKAESWRAGDSRWSWGSTPLSPIPLSPAPQPSPSYGRCGLVSGPLSPPKVPLGMGWYWGLCPHPKSPWGLAGIRVFVSHPKSPWGWAGIGVFVSHLKSPWGWVFLPS